MNKSQYWRVLVHSQDKLDSNVISAIPSVKYFPNLHVRTSIIGYESAQLHEQK
jgi:hypothetical protein